MPGTAKRKPRRGHNVMPDSSPSSGAAPSLRRVVSIATASAIASSVYTVLTVALPQSRTTRITTRRGPRCSTSTCRKVFGQADQLSGMKSANTTQSRPILPSTTGARSMSAPRGTP
jgi:hypothetical protein